VDHKWSEQVTRRSKIQPPTSSKVSLTFDLDKLWLLQADPGNPKEIDLYSFSFTTKKWMLEYAKASGEQVELVEMVVMPNIAYLEERERSVAIRAVGAEKESIIKLDLQT
jgi:hypothetical protein